MNRVNVLTLSLSRFDQPAQASLAATAIRTLGLSPIVDWLLFTREPNNPLVRFGNSLAIWLADVTRFQTCATDEKLFPWRTWPTAG
jgi:hypothetical protein